MPKFELTQPERICLARIRARNLDMQRTSLEAITRNSITPIGAGIFRDEEWLIKMMDRFTEGRYADDRPATVQELGGPVLSAAEMGQIGDGSEEDSLP